VLLLLSAFQLLVFADLHALLHAFWIVITGAAAVGTAIGFERSGSCRRIQEGFDLRVRFPRPEDGGCVASRIGNSLPSFLEVLGEASAFLQGEFRTHTRTQLCVCI